MKLSEALVLYAEFWFADLDLGDTWHKSVCDHMYNLCGHSFPGCRQDSCATLCLLEAEYQRDLENLDR